MELKACPFCGAKVLGPCRADYYGAFYIIKHEESCFFKTIFGQHETTIRERSGKINVWNTRTTDPLLKEMAEALLIAKDIINRYANNNKRIAGYSNIEDALQKYHEHVGDTNAG